MLDIKEAYKILGVRENASRDEVERRFAIILKKYRMAGTGQADEEDSKIDIDKVTKAYNLIMGYEEQLPEEEVNKKPNPVFQKIGLDEKKTRNFLYYYKYHIIIGIIALIAIIATLKSCITRVDPDLNLAFVGEFYYSDSESLKQAIKNKVPDIKEPGIDGVILSGNLDPQQEYAMHMKAMVLFAAADVDIYVLDKENFEKYAKQGAFASLDGLVDTLKIDMSKNSEYRIKLEDSQEEHLYGVDVSENPIFEESGIMGEEKIAAMAVKVKNYENAVKLLKMLLE